MDRISEMLAGGLAIVMGVLTKRIYSRQDQIEARVHALEKLVLTKEDLEPLQKTVNIILEHIINSKK